MTTAATLSSTAGEIVTAALRLIGEVDANQPVDAVQMQDGLEAFNGMIKGYQSQGLHLWTKTEGILPLDIGKTDYLLGPTGDEAGNLDDFVNTELSVAGIATDRTLDVDSTIGMTGAVDQFASDPANSTQGWTAVGGTIASDGDVLTVANAGAAAGEAERTITGLVVGRAYRIVADFTLGTSVAVTYSVKDGAATLGNATLTATGAGKFDFVATQTTHVLEILNGSTAGVETTLTSRLQLLDNTTGDLVGIRLDDNTRQWSKVVEVLSATQIFTADALTGPAAIDNSVYSFPALIPRPLRILQARRSTTGSDSEIPAVKWSRQQYFAQPNKTSQGSVNNWYYSPQLTDGRLHVWQTASNVDQVIKFTYIRPINISSETVDIPDFPSEWYRTLKYNLAAEIAPEYRLPLDRLSYIVGKAAEFLDDSLGYDVEDDSLNIQPDFGN